MGHLSIYGVAHTESGQQICDALISVEGMCFTNPFFPARPVCGMQPTGCHFHRHRETPMDDLQYWQTVGAQEE